MSKNKLAIVAMPVIPDMWKAEIGSSRSKASMVREPESLSKK
jgi:hypothetical protein